MDIEELMNSCLSQKHLPISRYMVLPNFPPSVAASICDISPVLPFPGFPVITCNSATSENCTPNRSIVYRGGRYGSSKSRKSSSTLTSNQSSPCRNSGRFGCASPSVGSGILLLLSSCIVPYIFHGLAPQIIVVWWPLCDGYRNILNTQSGLVVSQSIGKITLAGISRWWSEWLVLMFAFSRPAVFAVILTSVGFLLLLPRQIFLAVAVSPQRVTLRSRHSRQNGRSSVCSPSAYCSVWAAAGCF